MKLGKKHDTMNIWYPFPYIFIIFQATPSTFVEAAEGRLCYGGWRGLKDNEHIGKWISNIYGGAFLPSFLDFLSLS